MKADEFNYANCVVDVPGARGSLQSRLPCRLCRSGRRSKSRNSGLIPIYVPGRAITLQWQLIGPILPLLTAK